MAEFHDPFLRKWLSTYVSQVESEECAREILEDDAAFHKAVGNYKNVVTHFFCFKQESWVPTMLHNIYGITHLSGVKEFAKGRGAIHEHMTGNSNTAVDHKIDAFLVTLAIQSYYALEVIDEYIDKHLEPEDRLPLKRDEEPTNPLEIMGNAGMEARRKLLSNSPEGIYILNTFDAKLDELKREAAKGISYWMENEFGYSATHIGSAPSDWVLPGGQPGSGHRQTCSDMMTKADVREKKVLRKYKFQQENQLFARCIDMTNHVATHQCSDYCWKPVRIDVPYDRAKHGPLENNDRIVSIKNTLPDGRQIAQYKVFECRMGFGYQLRVSVGGHRTGGKPAVGAAYIEFDPNGQPKYYGARNHPRVVQEPVTTIHWGANCDLQRFMTNRKSYDKVTELGIDHDKFAQSLNILGMAGLEQNTGNYIAIDYVTGYQTKGNASTKEWGSALQDLQDTLLLEDQKIEDENTGKDKTTMRQLVGKHMHTIAKSQDISKEEAVFCLSGGQLKHNSMKVMTCSLNRVEFSDFVSAADSDDPSSGSNNTSWTYLALRTRYKEYGSKVDAHVLLNFNTWCARHGTHSSISVMPDFIGYHKRPSWPLDEDYARTMLVFYKPFIGDEDSLKGDNESFADALMEFVTNPIFPRSIEAEIRRKRQSYRYISEAGEEYHQRGALECTPNEDEREHVLNEEALATAVGGPFDNEHEVFQDDIQNAEFNEGDIEFCLTMV